MPTVQKDSAVLLCIDSNLDVLGCEKAFLEAFGYTVLTAPSDSKGLELASVHSVDVVIVDYFMPEMNGQEFAIRMRRLKPKARQRFRAEGSVGEPLVARNRAIAGKSINLYAFLRSASRAKPQSHVQS
jgi:CheY-like chemotaxis protein